MLTGGRLSTIELEIEELCVVERGVKSAAAMSRRCVADALQSSWHRAIYATEASLK